MRQPLSISQLTAQMHFFPYRVWMSVQALAKLFLSLLHHHTNYQLDLSSCFKVIVKDLKADPVKETISVFFSQDWFRPVSADLLPVKHSSFWLYTFMWSWLHPCFCTVLLYGVCLQLLMTRMVSLQSLEKAFLHHHDGTKHPYTWPLNVILSPSAFRSTITAAALSKVGASSNKQILMFLLYSTCS